MKSTRINLAIPLEMAISIEKECDRRGVDRTKYIREAIFEKLKKTNDVDQTPDRYNALKDEINEMKNILRLILDKVCN